MPARRFAPASLCLLVLACGSKTPAPPPPGAAMACPAPIGVVPKEDCAAIAADFGALSVQGALPLAATGKDEAPKVEAIRAVGALAQSIKDQRVKLCERYVKCQVPLAEHDAQDQVLTSAMTSLADLWNKRRLTGRDEVVRFREAVRAIDRRVNGGAESVPPPPPAPKTWKAVEALARVENPDIAFRAEAGAVTVSRSANPAEADALLSKPDVLELASGHRYSVKLTGSYRPAAPPLLAPGDEILARVRYRAEGAASLRVTLPSLEDPDATDAGETFRTSAADKSGATHEVKLVANPAETGFSLDLAVADAPVEIESVELLRGGAILLTARAGDAGVRTGCGVKPAKGAKGTKPAKKAKDASGILACGPGQHVRIGEPAGYLVFGLRDATGKRASTRTLSLEGGRSVDAAVGNDARVWVALVGLGSATIDQVEVTEILP